MSFEFPDSIVLDSSVVIKWFRSYEILRDQAIKLRQAYLNGNMMIVVPDILIYEIANVLRYKSDMDPLKVKYAIQSLFDMEIDIQNINLDIMERTVEIAYNFNTTIYDSAFVALAENLGIGFVTADDKLIQKLYGFPDIYHLSEI